MEQNRAGERLSTFNHEATLIYILVNAIIVWYFSPSNPPIV